MAAQIITDCGNFTLDFKQHGCCASPLFLQTLGPWFPNEMQNLLSSEKRTLDHWVLFLHSPGKTLLTLSLVQKWLGSPFPEDVWAWWLLMHWLQLQSTPCEALTRVWISFAWQYSQASSHPCGLSVVIKNPMTLLVKSRGVTPVSWPNSLHWPLSIMAS